MERMQADACCSSNLPLVVEFWMTFSALLHFLSNFSVKILFYIDSHEK